MRTTLLTKRSLLFVALSLALVSAFFFTQATPSSAGNPPKSDAAVVFPQAQPEIGLKGDDEIGQGAGPVPVCGVKLEDYMPAQELPALSATTCILGDAGGFPCNNVNLHSFLPLASIGGGGSILASSLWGWTHTQSGREFALIGLRNGTSFVEVTDPANPVYLGKLATHTGTSAWRELKVYQNHAFIVSDSNGNHGIQIFDLTQLLNVAAPPVAFSETAHYGNAGSIHNIWINEESGYAYAVGTASGAATCSGGLHMINVQNPTSPTFAGCFASDGYTHDVQCINYNGPDADYVGHEICVGSNTDTITIVDVTNKSNPIQISRTSYPGVGYTHQSWFTDDRQYMVVDDELDEDGPPAHNARTYIWNMTNLDAPVMFDYYDSVAPSIDHNQYMSGGYLYQANYRAGLRVLNYSDIANGNMNEVGFFDIYPPDDNPSFNGAWNVYPFFPSGNVIVSGIEQGLFVLDPTVAPPTAVTVETMGSTAGVSPLAIPSIAALALLGLVGAGLVWRRRAAR